MDARVPGSLGRVLSHCGEPVGTCFQVRPGVVVTAQHVLTDAGAHEGPERTVLVDGLLAGGAPPVPATVLAEDAVHDVAVLRRREPLPDSVAGLVATDSTALGEPVVVTGHSLVDDAVATVSHRHLDAPGTWAGGTARDDGVRLGRLSSSDVLRGMSGGPVRRRDDGMVVGVLLGRYNSADGWLRDACWVARTEDLLPLLLVLPETADLRLGQPQTPAPARSRFSPADVGPLLRLLRESLSSDDVAFVAAVYGPRSRLPRSNLAERLPGSGLDAKIAHLVDDAGRTESAEVLLQCVREVRPDLAEALPAAVSSTPRAPG